MLGDPGTCGSGQRVQQVDGSAAGDLEVGPHGALPRLRREGRSGGPHPGISGSHRELARLAAG
jgi:hypothetical protein